ncbi:MAG: PRC-barrel domain-containing protein [Candidatus Hadarchaeia archaeon]
MRASEYYDMPIYSDNGNYVGEVQEVVLDVEDGVVLGLGFGKSQDRVTSVPYENVMAIGDIILVKSEAAKKAKSGGESENQ